ncbi:MAG: insulinase family protein [Melioribacteraceae bacterium]|nr:insulinase family protein [Melioribacteraceae bacterium]
MKINRTKIPSSDIPRPFDIPNINSFNLSNGLPVFFTQKSKLPIVKISLIVPAGSRYDGYGNEGLSYLTSLVIDEGAGNYNALQLADEIDKLGSSIDVSTSVDHIFITMSSLSENYKRTLELLSLIFKSPLFAKDNYSRERKKHLTRILQSFDSPEYIAANAFQKNIFKNSPYDKPVLGYEKSVEHLKLQQIKDFYNRFVLSNGVKIVAIGDVQKEELFLQLEYLFSDLSIKTKRNTNELHLAKLVSKLYLINKEDSAQSEIIAGHICKERNAEDHLAAKVANTILGGQFTSRLNLNLRETKGYTYGAHSAISYNKQAGYFTISTSAQSEFTFNSIREIRKEVDGIRIHISDEEISFAKSSLIKQFPLMFETYSQILQRVTTKVIFDLEDYYDHYIQNIWELSKNEILQAANEYFNPANLSFFVVGNKNEIFDDLKRINDLELIELDKLGNPIN